MTTHQIELLQQSWLVLKPIAPEVGINFYKKLFEVAPGVRRLFKDDINLQADKLMQMLGYIIAMLKVPGELLPEVRKLAVRHNQYSAEPVHYEIVGQCLIETLREGLGKNWNAELQDAWITAYSTLKNVMITAQEEVRQNGIQKVV